MSDDDPVIYVGKTLLGLPYFPDDPEVMLAILDDYQGDMQELKNVAVRVRKMVHAIEEVGRAAEEGESMKALMAQLEKAARLLGVPTEDDPGDGRRVLVLGRHGDAF